MVEEAIGCADAGADLFVFVFVPRSKRVVSVDNTRCIASILNERSLPLDQTETEIGMAPWFTTYARSIDRERSRGRLLLVGIFKSRQWRWYERRYGVCRLMS
jgi:phosphoribosylanthranilate isomerase